MQAQLKKTSSGLLLFLVKLISGLVLGLTFALVAEVMLGHAEDEGVIVFTFVMILTAGAFLRLARTWSMTTVFVFDLFCILVGMLLRLYIMVAPDA